MRIEFGLGMVMVASASNQGKENSVVIEESFKKTVIKSHIDIFENVMRFWHIIVSRAPML